MLATAAIAVFAVPITVDSMTYHLARVAYWVQAASIRLLSDARHPPDPPARRGPSTPCCTCIVLWGGDRLANLVQWGSMILSLVGVSVIARQLGAGTRGQLLERVRVRDDSDGHPAGWDDAERLRGALWLVCLASPLLAMASRSGLAPVLVAGGQPWSRSPDEGHRVRVRRPVGATPRSLVIAVVRLPPGSGRRR